jgi:ketosteroid isomerase-like protein
MSRERAEVVRQGVALQGRPRRPPDERLGVRFPGALTLLTRLVLRLRPRSRLRQALIRRAVKLALDAANRSDFEAAFALYDSQVELITEPRVVGLGLERVYHGREERIRFQQRWIEDWGDFQFDPKEVIDIGDGRVLVWGRILGSGLSSGAGFASDWAVLLTTSSAGRVVREEFFFDHAEALEAVGMRT